MKEAEIRIRAILSGIDEKQYHAIDTSLSEGTPFKHCSVKDSEGNSLEEGKRYLLNGKITKVLRWEFGGGNFLDTYYRVWYLDDQLRDRMVVVEAKYQKDTFPAATYPSDFCLVPD